MTRLPILQLFPEIERLGQPRLQEICNRWLQTPIAKEFAVTELLVEDDGQLWLSFQCKMTHRIQSGEEYYFPMDELLTFIVDQGVAESEQESAKARIRNARKNGPDVYRKFRINPGPKLPLFVTCPHCGNVLQTQFLAYRS